MTDTLIVMLPGALMAPQDFISAGFADCLSRHWPAAELMPLPIEVNQLDVDACVEALAQQLAAIRSERPHPRLILGGISMGAAVALHYARLQPADIASLCLLAPYPGSRITTGAIRSGGGPAAWQADEVQRRDGEFLLWEWLIRGHDNLPVYLGYGRGDRFADGLTMMADAMPAATCHTVAGDHDWPTWQALWQDFVARHSQQGKH